jgi:hypothetical protein
LVAMPSNARPFPIPNQKLRYFVDNDTPNFPSTHINPSPKPNSFSGSERDSVRQALRA